MPTANASSASSDRLSYGDGHDDHGRGLERLQAFPLGQQPWKRMNGSSGSFISFTPMSTSDASPPSGDVAAEVLDQFLAALAGIDASAVQRQRTVQPVPAPEHGAALGDVRRTAVGNRRRPADRRVGLRERALVVGGTVRG